MSVLNRKMFNRGARKELRKKGGIEDVQYFQTAGPVVAPFPPVAPKGNISLNFPKTIFGGSRTIFLVKLFLHQHFLEKCLDLEKDFLHLEKHLLVVKWI